MKGMKLYRFFVVLLMITVTFGGCQFKKTQPIANTELPNDIESVIYSYKELSNGGYLVALWYESEYGEKEIIFAVYDFKEDNQSLVVNSHDPRKEMPIFDDSAGKLIAYSGFEIVDIDGQAELLVFITPNQKVTNSGTEPYEESQYYGITPYDSLGTNPMQIQTPDWNANYPLWVFAIPMSRIDSNYSLTFAEFVLTGAEIMDSSQQYTHTLGS